MSHPSVSNLTARELHDFGFNLRRKTIFEIIIMGFSFVLSIGASIALYFTMSDPYIWEELISQITYLPIIPIILGLFGLVIIGLSITSLVFTILMLISISSLRDSPNHPELQKSSLLLLIGYVLSLIGISLIGIILQLIGWDSFRKYLTTLQSGGSKNSEKEMLQRTIRNYIIVSIIIMVINQVLTIIMLSYLMSFFMEFITNIELYTDFPYEYFLDNPIMTIYSGIFSVISVVLGIIPMIFSLKIAHGIRSQFQYAQTYPKSTSTVATQSYTPLSFEQPNLDSPKESERNHKYCLKCGQKNLIEAQFCSICGERI